MTTEPSTPTAADHQPGDPISVLLTSQWASILGVCLIGTALISWLFVFPLQMRGRATNPYIGIFMFALVPPLFFLGLALIPVGVWRAKRRIRRRLEAVVTDRAAARRRLLAFLAITTAINKMTWGIYPNNIGHTDFPGCFRCHDGAHATADGKTITRSCTSCHEIPAIAEASPEVLKTLGLANSIAALRRQ
jgi:hypothetical protein